jgi:iron complex transport system ATP-binding protein
MVGPGASLCLDRVCFAFGERAVLNELELLISPGEAVAVLGPNGAGKTTLLSLASGRLRPQRGAVLLDGIPLPGLGAEERARRVAVVPQFPVVPAGFTLREWVALGRTPYLHPFRGESATDRGVVEWALLETRLADLADRPGADVSGGEQQRAALAQALAQQPRLLLLDEATAHLDLEHQAGLLRLLRTLNRRNGLTLVAAMHDLNQAAVWFDRLVLLQGGRVAADGPPEQVLREDTLQPVFRARLEVLSIPGRRLPFIAPPAPGDDAVSGDAAP